MQKHTHKHTHSHMHIHCCSCCSCFPLANKRRRFCSFFLFFCFFFLLFLYWRCYFWPGFGFGVCFCPKCSLNRKSKIAALVAEEGNRAIGEKRRWNVDNGKGKGHLHFPIVVCELVIQMFIHTYIHILLYIYTYVSASVSVPLLRETCWIEFTVQENLMFILIWHILFWVKFSDNWIHYLAYDREEKIIKYFRHIHS